MKAAVLSYPAFPYSTKIRPNSTIFNLHRKATKNRSESAFRAVLSVLWQSDRADRDHTFNRTQLIEVGLGGSLCGVDDGVRIITLGTVAHILDVAANSGGDGRDHVRDVLVDHADAVAAFVRNLEVREVDRVADGALLEVLGNLVNGHLSAVVLALRRGCTQMRERDGILLLEDLVGSKVGNVCCNLAALECLRHCLGVNQLAARKVDDANAVLHFLDRLCADGVLRVSVQRNMNGDVVAVCENLVQLGNVLDRAVELECAVNRQVRVIAPDLHIQANSRVCNLNADRTQTDDAQLLAGDFRACLDCGGIVRSKHGRQHDCVGMLACRFGTFRWLKHHGDQIAAVFVGSGIVIDGAGSVGTVGEQRFQVCVLAFRDRAVAGDTPAQPIVRQADRGDLLGVSGSFSATHATLVSV